MITNGKTRLQIKVVDGISLSMNFTSNGEPILLSEVYKMLSMDRRQMVESYGMVEIWFNSLSGN